LWGIVAIGPSNSADKAIMPFQPVAIHTIRSSNQRALAAHWNMLAAGRRFPAIADFNPQAKDHSPEQLILWDVETSGSGRQFRVRRMGLRAAEALGTGLVGKTMEELVPPALRAISLEGANECAASGSAIYAIITTIANGHQVDCERLLLPFGGDGSAVEQIVASLQLISFQGAVERQEVSRDFETRSQMSFSGRINSDWGARNPLVTVASPALAPEPAGELLAVAQGAGGNPARDDAPTADKRRAARRKVLKTGKIHFGKSREVCTVRDLSSTGASLELARSINVPDRFTLVLEMESAARNCTVAWRRDRQLGVQFG
jgi:hypothetical protein